MQVTCKRDSGCTSLTSRPSDVATTTTLCSVLKEAMTFLILGS